MNGKNSIRTNFGVFNSYVFTAKYLECGKKGRDISLQHSPVSQEVCCGNKKRFNQLHLDSRLTLESHDKLHANSRECIGIRSLSATWQLPPVCGFTLDSRLIDTNSDQHFFPSRESVFFHPRIALRVLWAFEVKTQKS